METRTKTFRLKRILRRTNDTQLTLVSITRVNDRVMTPDGEGTCSLCSREFQQFQV